VPCIAGGGSGGARTTGKQDWALFLEKRGDFIQCRNEIIWKPGRGIDTLGFSACPRRAGRRRGEGADEIDAGSRPNRRSVALFYCSERERRVDMMGRGTGLGEREGDKSAQVTKYVPNKRKPKAHFR
jgi:hypothetical protein